MTQHAFKPLLINLLRQGQVGQNTFFQALPPAELEIIGEPDYWSAKDHVAHLTFWRQALVLKLQAHFRQEAQPKSKHFELVNPIVFEQNRYRLWPEILQESDRVYDTLIALTEQLTEEDITAFNRFAWMSGGIPLYLSYMGNCYEHTQIHLCYYLLERDYLDRALDTHELWASRIVDIDSPHPLKGNILYNLACFYATHDRLQKAVPTLQQAFTLYPDLSEFAKTDPDLTALYPNQSV